MLRNVVFSHASRCELVSSSPAREKNESLQTDFGVRIASLRLASDSNPFSPQNCLDRQRFKPPRSQTWQCTDTDAETFSQLKTSTIDMTRSLFTSLHAIYCLQSYGAVTTTPTWSHGLGLAPTHEGIGPQWAKSRWSQEGFTVEPGSEPSRNGSGANFQWNDSGLGSKVRVTGQKPELLLQTKSQSYSWADPQNPNRIAQNRNPNRVWVFLQHPPPLKAFLNPPNLDGCFLCFLFPQGVCGLARICANILPEFARFPYTRKNDATSFLQLEASCL